MAATGDTSRITFDHAGFTARFDAPSSHDPMRNHRMPAAAGALMAVSAGIFMAITTTSPWPAVASIGAGLLIAAFKLHVGQAQPHHELHLAGRSLTLTQIRGEARTRTDLPLPDLLVEFRERLLLLRSGGQVWRLPLDGWDPASIEALSRLLTERAQSAAPEEVPEDARTLLGQVARARAEGARS